MKKSMNSNRMQDFAKFSQLDSKLDFSPITEEVQNFTSMVPNVQADHWGGLISSEEGILIWW